MCKRYIHWLPLTRPQLGGLAHNPGMCPNEESNQWPFGSQACSQSTEPHQPGLYFAIFLCIPVLLVYSKYNWNKTEKNTFDTHTIWLMGAMYKESILSWLMWLSGLSAGLQTKRFYSQSGHMPGLWARPPVGGVWEAANQCFFHTSMFLFLSFPSPLFKNK